MFPGALHKNILSLIRRTGKMKSKIVMMILVVTILATMGLVGCKQQQQSASAVTASGNPAIGDPSRANQEYVWISQFSSLPTFVERVYPALERFAHDYGVKVRVAGPSTVDLAGFITTVEQEAAKRPAGIIVVGGWDDSLTEPVNKAIAMGVPVIVNDGDLPESNRLAYCGTDWYELGVLYAKIQLDLHSKAGLNRGEVAIICPVNSGAMQEAINGFKDTIDRTFLRLATVEDNQSQIDVAAQRTSAVISAYPNLSGIVALDTESGPGIVAAVDEMRKTGQLILTLQESGREFLDTVREGRVQLILMERYDIMNYMALTYLYYWHNKVLNYGNMDPWKNNWIPDTFNSGVILVTKEKVDEIISAMDAEAQAAKNLTVYKN